MASQLAAGAPAGTPAQLSASGRIVKFLVHRRVAISALLFTSLVLLDIIVFHCRPRNVLNLADPFVAPAELLILAGLALRSWAAGTLRKRKELATSGPYAWIRHPLYAGSFLMMVGFGILVHDPLTLWIVVGPVAWLYWQAVKSEEQHLEKIFREHWLKYAAVVPRFVPRKLIRPRAQDWSLLLWLHNAEYQAWLGSGVALVGMKLWQMWA